MLSPSCDFIAILSLNFFKKNCQFMHHKVGLSLARSEWLNKSYNLFTMSQDLFQSKCLAVPLTYNDHSIMATGVYRLVRIV